jgi:hypothetical protein
MWAKPRAAPPPKAKPKVGIFFGAGTWATGSGGLTAGGGDAQAANSSKMPDRMGLKAPNGRALELIMILLWQSVTAIIVWLD